MGMVTVRSGSALRVTVTVASFSFTDIVVPVSSVSATLYVAEPKATVTLTARRRP